MPEAVIVATGRTPIGRANKGSLVTCRPDDLTAHVVTEVLAKVPQLDPAQIEDLIVGCGQPAGELLMSPLVRKPSTTTNSSGTTVSPNATMATR